MRPGGCPLLRTHTQIHTYNTRNTDDTHTHTLTYRHSFSTHMQCELNAGSHKLLFVQHQVCKYMWVVYLQFTAKSSLSIVLLASVLYVIIILLSWFERYSILQKFSLFFVFLLGFFPCSSLICVCHTGWPANTQMYWIETETTHTGHKCVSLTHTKLTQKRWVQRRYIIMCNSDGQWGNVVGNTEKPSKYPSPVQWKKNTAVVVAC